jgi:SAM-dependent methyltransferase
MSTEPASPPPPGGGFDQYAANYEAALQQGLAVSGERKEYFARGRLLWLQERLRELGFRAGVVLDFGCGIGTAAPFVHELLSPRELVGVDIAAGALEEARREHGSANTRFHQLDQYAPAGEFDLAFCNGVFHHIPLQERDSAAGYVWRGLRPGGLFAFWENNPWNPGTRYVMSRVPFDRDALTLAPPEARRLLRRAGFAVLRTDFLFIFPRFLRWFRGLEPALCRWPLGAQYLVLCRRPAA